MSPLALRILQITIASSALIAAVVLFRFVLLKAKCSRGAVLVLWVAVGIRLLLPFSVGSAIGVLPGLLQEDVFPAAVSGEAVEALAVDSASPHISLETLLLLSYFIGVTAMLVYYIVSFARLARLVRRAQSLGEGIYVSGEVDAAFTFGVFSPRIILPAGLPEFVGRVVVRHEDEHLRHGDQFWKPLAFFLLAFHWFNPLVWLAYFLFVRDLEFACDDRAARYMTVSERKEYSEALLLLGTAARPTSIQAVAFGEGNVEQRIKAVCRLRRPAAVLSVIAVILAVTFGALAMFHRETDFSRRAAPDTDNVTMVPQELGTVLPEDPYGTFSRTTVQEPEPSYDVTGTPVRED